MYESYFNLTAKPFDLVPNPEFLFHSKSHKRALTYLDYGIRERAGFILLTGEIGSGKTTIIRDLINKRHERVLLSKIFNTQVNFEQLIAMVNDDFNLPVQGKDKVSLLRDLNDFLIEQYALGNKPTLIIDEAQNLSLEILEEIRMLSNLETDNAKLLQIILVGQPELRRTLAMPSLLQLRQRISINCHINPLSRLEVEEYILHRLAVVGNREAVIFSKPAFDMIYTFSRGIPRLINVICDFLLLSAFAEETREIGEEIVRDIVGDLDFENQYWTSDPTGKAPGVEPVASKAEAVQSEGELASVLRQITHRLDSMEKESVEFRQLISKELDEKLTSWKNAFVVHIEDTSATLCTLSKNVEKVRNEWEALTVHEEGKPEKEGFLRRIFK